MSDEYEDDARAEWLDVATDVAVSRARTKDNAEEVAAFASYIADELCRGATSFAAREAEREEQEEEAEDAENAAHCANHGHTPPGPLSGIPPFLRCCTRCGKNLAKAAKEREKAAADSRLDD